MATAHANILLARQFAEGDFPDAEVLVEQSDEKFVVKVMLESGPFYIGLTRGGIRKFAQPRTVLKFCEDDLNVNSVTWVFNSTGEQKQSEMNLS